MKTGLGVLLFVRPALRELFKEPNVRKQRVMDTQMRPLEHDSLRYICLSVNFKSRRDLDHTLLFYSRVSSPNSGDESPVSRVPVQSIRPSQPVTLPSLLLPTLPLPDPVRSPVIIFCHVYCAPMFSAQTFRKKIFRFNFFNSIFIYLYLGTCFLYYKGILAFIFEHMLQEILCNN